MLTNRSFEGHFGHLYIDLPMWKWTIFFSNEWSFFEYALLNNLSACVDEMCSFIKVSTFDIFMYALYHSIFPSLMKDYLQNLGAGAWVLWLSCLPGYTLTVSEEKTVAATNMKQWCYHHYPHFLSEKTECNFQAVFWLAITRIKT